ncbi:hypothetical protein MTBUT4_60197 [Magnetospirillum sp. UT-4]|nr:hypothetical protein MTBUT4_60197 [Magnetospirillum sp. UT-4]
MTSPNGPVRAVKLRSVSAKDIPRLLNAVELDLAKIC